MSATFPNETRILVVDDMLTMRKLVRKALSELGYTSVVDVDSGEKAWETLSTALDTPEPFGLVISDWQMPGMKGIELLKKVRSAPRTKALPFVLLTAEGERGQVMEAVQLGVSSYVVKPFTPQALRERLKSAWDLIQRPAKAA